MNSQTEGHTRRLHRNSHPEPRPTSKTTVLLGGVASTKEKKKRNQPPAHRRVSQGNCKELGGPKRWLRWGNWETASETLKNEIVAQSGLGLPGFEHRLGRYKKSYVSQNHPTVPLFPAFVKPLGKLSSCSSEKFEPKDVLYRVEHHTCRTPYITKSRNNTQVVVGQIHVLILADGHLPCIRPIALSEDASALVDLSARSTTVPDIWAVGVAMMLSQCIPFLKWVLAMELCGPILDSELQREAFGWFCAWFVVN
jgi:hypothetical protein